MGQVNLDQIVGICGMLIAAITLLLSFRRDGNAERDRQAAQSAEKQVMNDKLDSIGDMSRETRDTVRKMSEQLNVHSVQLTRLEQRVSDSERRIGQIEDRIDGLDAGRGR